VLDDPKGPKSADPVVTRRPSFFSRQGAQLDVGPQDRRVHARDRLERIGVLGDHLVDQPELELVLAVERMVASVVRICRGWVRGVL